MKSIHSLAALLALAGCAQMGALAPSAPGGIPGTEGATGVVPAQVPDADEGVTQPMQTAHEGTVVFSNTPIARAGASEKQLVTSSTLSKPLYMRAFFPKTPMRLLAEASAKKKVCALDDVQMTYEIWSSDAKGPNGPNTYTLRRADPSEEVYRTSRSASLMGVGEKLASIVPQEKFVMLLPKDREPEDELPHRFTEFVMTLKPGKQKVSVGVFFRCKDVVLTEVSASRGEVELDIGSGDVAKYARKVGPTVRPSRSDDEKAIKAAYQKSLVPGATLLGFSVGERKKNNDGLGILSGSSTLSILLKNADGTCGYQQATWTDYWGALGQRWENGEYKVWDNQLMLPCP